MKDTQFDFTISLKDWVTNKIYAVVHNFYFMIFGPFGRKKKHKENEMTAWDFRKRFQNGKFYVCRIPSTDILECFSMTEVEYMQLSIVEMLSDDFVSQYLAYNPCVDAPFLKRLQARWYCLH